MTDLRFVRVLGYTLLGTLVAAAAFAGIWRMTGGTIERVETPSMGTRAPVGSLLWTRPAAFDRLRPGDFVSFHPPDDRTKTYSHLVHARNRDGTLTTKGLISSPDPWRLTDNDVIGKVSMNWPGAGWLIQCAPVLLIGGLLTALLTRMSRPHLKLALALLGASLTISAALSMERPLVNAQQLAFSQVPQGARATYVGTGLLPVRLRAHQGEAVTMRAGEMGSVLITQKDELGRYRADLAPAIPRLFWIILIGVCFVPAIWILVVGLPTQAGDSDTHHA